MNTSEIESILTQGLKGTNSKFLGVFESDRLRSHIQSFPSCLVANTDPHNHPVLIGWLSTSLVLDS